MGFPPQQPPVPWQRSSPYNDPPLFVIPSVAEGSAVPRTFPGTQNLVPPQICHLDRSVAEWR
ncbi:MAG: hypothetical protein QOJ51_3531, partial [Acidobacteriaceae bacterium]|nr:hypothetical protein [Acidobacteriaceae bacterium]